MVEAPRATGEGAAFERDDEYLVAVRPDDETTPPFSASVQERFKETTATGLHEGPVVRAKLRSKDKRIKFDRRGGSVQVVRSAG